MNQSISNLNFPILKNRHQTSVSLKIPSTLQIAQILQAEQNGKPEMAWKERNSAKAVVNKQNWKI